jgi:nitrite reductase (NADH) small subunit
MTEQPMTDDRYEVVALTTEIAPGSLKKVSYRGEAVVLVQAGERYFALANTCAHQAISLSLGRLFRGQLVCPGHAWMYDLETGRVSFPRETDASVPTYDVRVEGEQIFIAPRPAS